jgi:hypothetical protein
VLADLLFSKNNRQNAWMSVNNVAYFVYVTVISKRTWNVLQATVWNSFKSLPYNFYVTFWKRTGPRNDSVNWPTESGSRPQRSVTKFHQSVTGSVTFASQFTGLFQLLSSVSGLYSCNSIVRKSVGESLPVFIPFTGLSYVFSDATRPHDDKEAEDSVSPW